MKKITIVTGHYGSGKTTLSVNLALRAAAEGSKAAIVDLDIVNPYFRTADFRELFAEKGVNLIAPDFANSNLDIPSIQFDVAELAMTEDSLIIDVGGDDAGATALGRYADALREFCDDIDMLYVINQRRYLTRTPEEAVQLMYEIEAAAHMKHTAIVNNTNLGRETDIAVIESSRDFAVKVAEATGLPVKYTVYPEKLAELSDSSDVLSVITCVRTPWDVD